MSDRFTQPLVPIYTIGYGERSIAALVQVLQHYQITYVVDVRSAPYSRYKPEFSKAPLETELRRQALRYLFMGDALGGRPEDPACYTDGKVDYEKLKMTTAYQQGIGRLQTAFAKQQRVVLLCSEGKPEQCHRSKLIGATLTHLAIPVVHIDEHDAPQSQDAIIERLTDGQLALFGEHTFHSRKRYAQEAKAGAAPEESEDDNEHDSEA